MVLFFLATTTTVVVVVAAVATETERNSKKKKKDSKRKTKKICERFEIRERERASLNGLGVFFCRRSLFRGSFRGSFRGAFLVGGQGAILVFLPVLPPDGGGERAAVG